MKRIESYERIKIQKGITLIALVITIIILIILTGIVIASLTGDNGLFARAREAKDNYEEVSIEEMIEIYRMEKAETEENETLKEKLIKDGTIDEKKLVELDQNGICSVSENIIVVSNYQGLKKISNNVEQGFDYSKKKIYLVNDIDCGSNFDLDTGDLLSGDNFNPIGDSNSKIEDEGAETSDKQEFNGIFDGFDYKITNLYIKEINTNEFCTGLFGYVGEEGIVKNLVIADSYIHGYYETGAIVGRNKGKIINCVNESSVIGDYYLTGGIAGRNCNLIDSCINKGEVYRRNSNRRNCSELRFWYCCCK